LKVRVSIFSSPAERDYDSPYAWPAGTFLQAGDSGIVLPSGSLRKVLTDDKAGAQVVGAALGVAEPPEGAYTTAFLEAFPKHPATFIRGEGKTIAEADASAWRQFQRFAACPKHKFWRKGYTNGAGFCRCCGLFKSKAFRPIGRCRYNCKGAVADHDAKGRGYCKRHNQKNPNRMFDRVDGRLVMRSKEERSGS
jgi:hypothetical protein